MTLLLVLFGVIACVVIAALAVAATDPRYYRGDK